MNRRDFLKFAGMNITSTLLLGCHQGDSLRAWPQGAPLYPEVSERPNFIIILCDNLGYGDLGCYGSTVHRTPYVDQMAKEGMRLTSFYASSGVCTPSRASLMTGCYAQRVDMHISDKNGRVLRPVSAKGLNPNEVTLAEILQKQGYATACIGKWHLGDQPEFLPRNHGFDYFYGIPYSEDMTPSHTPAWPPLPLIRNEEVVEAPVDLTGTTRRYLKEAMRFISENCDRPFFLYFAHHLPGSNRIPEVDPQFSGRSVNGRYGDSIEEIDFSVGQIIDALRKLDLDERTLLIFTSDNGTPRGHGGSNAPLAGWGYSTMEGGMRVPCIVRWPGMVPAGTTCNELCTTMDLLPTFVRLAGTEPPKDRIIDGKNIWHLLAPASSPLLSCPCLRRGKPWPPAGELVPAEAGSKKGGAGGAESPYEVFYYYMVDQLQAVRSDKWKLYLPLKKLRGKRASLAPRSRPMKLVDLSRDIGETTDLSQQHPEVVEKLLAWAEKARESLGDLGRKGRGQRPAGFVTHPTPRLLKR